MTRLPALYTDLADWWQVISPTSDYADEAAFFRTLFRDAGAQTLLELGAGGGNVAFYLKRDFRMTLTDLSPAMQAMSIKQNPECEHIAGDMRTLDLGRTFDGVLIHDAIMYMLTERDLEQTFATAARHLNPGGILVAVPDCTRETFQEGAVLEGHDAGNRAAQYIQWITDPDPTDTVFDCDFVIGLKEGGTMKSVVDRQQCGLFPRQTWLDLMTAAGFEARAVLDPSTAGESTERIEIFVGCRR